MPSITIRFVNAAGPGRHYDEKLPGFGLYVGAKGSRSYFLEYRPGRGRGVAKRRITIGRHGAPWTAATARDEALRLLGRIKAGSDPLAERDAAEQHAARTLAGLVEAWLARDQAKNRSRAEVERIMAREVLPVWGARGLEDIRKRDVIALIDGIADRGAPVAANRALAHIKRLFHWAASRDLIENDPAAHVAKVAAETRRDRVLDDAELVEVWQALKGASPAFRDGLRLLVLTGARRAEIFEASREELEERGLRLPAKRSKTASGRLIPLNRLARSIVEDRPVFEVEGRTSDWLITVDGKAPFSNIGHAKAHLDRAILEARRQRDPEAEAMPDWRLHDIRRSVATGLQRLGVRLEVIEAILGHVSGSRGGIVGVYQRHQFEDEARAALEAWGRHVEALLAGGAERKVVPLKRA